MQRISPQLTATNGSGKRLNSEHNLLSFPNVQPGSQVGLRKSAQPLTFTLGFTKSDMSLVGFFDMLGTRDSVMSDGFDDLISLDFAGPASSAARLFPSVRIAVFSDSVIISSKVASRVAFLKAVIFMQSHWIADFLFVRGGIACGDIRWVDHSIFDPKDRELTNFSCARVYGKGLVLAHDLEQRSGPGAISYLTESAANLLTKVHPNAVLDCITPMLCWETSVGARRLLGYAQINLERYPDEGHGRRHALATQRYWEQVVLLGKALPLSFHVQRESEDGEA
jgi:hypothetical protein